jgi:hypothetical protein
MAKHSSLPSPDMIPRRRATPPPSPEAGLIAAQPDPAPAPAPIPPPPLPEPMVSPAPIAPTAPMARPARAAVSAASPPAAQAEEGRVRALRGKIPHRKIGVRLDRERYQRLKRHAADHGLSVEEIAIAALDRYLADRRSS